MTSRGIAAAICVVLGISMLPAAARAQSTIAGVVKDTSGAVLPGVTVEASSDVLIERTRAVITDAAMIETSTVLSVMALATSSGSTHPVASQGTRVRLHPSRARRFTVSRTDLCSTAEATR